MNPPLHLANLNFTTDNIRNIHAPDNVYPSRFHANRGDFRHRPRHYRRACQLPRRAFPGARAQYTIENVPLSAFDPEIRQINIAVSGGRLSSNGLLEYSPKITRVEVDNATIDAVDVGYVHSPGDQASGSEAGKSDRQAD